MTHPDTAPAKFLTLHQPWASAIAMGAKTIETRSWPTKYRGPLIIHAGKRDPEDTPPKAWGIDQYPLGCIVAVCRLSNCIPTEQVVFEAGKVGMIEESYGDYTPGRWALILNDIHALKEPFPCRGMQGLWENHELAMRLIPRWRMLARGEQL